VEGNGITGPLITSSSCGLPLVVSTDFVPSGQIFFLPALSLSKGFFLLYVQSYVARRILSMICTFLPLFTAFKESVLKGLPAQLRVIEATTPPRYSSFFEAICPPRCACCRGRLPWLFLNLYPVELVSQFTGFYNPGALFRFFLSGVWRALSDTSYVHTCAARSRW